MTIIDKLLFLYGAVEFDFGKILHLYYTPLNVMTIDKSYIGMCGARLTNQSAVQFIFSFYNYTYTKKKTTILLTDVLSQWTFKKI